MECFSIAKVCKIKNIKFSSYKWVSDDGGFEDWVNNCRLGLKNLKYYFS
jgi:nucleoside phosphorylase